MDSENMVTNKYGHCENKNSKTMLTFLLTKWSWSSGKEFTVVSIVSNLIFFSQPESFKWQKTRILRISW